MRKNCRPNPVIFLVLEGCHLGLWKNLGPLRPNFSIYYFLGEGEIGPLQNSGSNPVTFPFLKGLTLDPMKVCPLPPPLGKSWRRPCPPLTTPASSTITNLRQKAELPSPLETGAYWHRSYCLAISGHWRGFRSRAFQRCRQPDIK